MSAPSRPEELSGGQRGPEDQAGQENRATPPALVVWVAISEHFDGTTVLGVGGSAERAREICEEDWYSESHRSTLHWDHGGAYWFAGANRRSAGYAIEEHPVT